MEKPFDVEIKETLRMTVRIEADNAVQADESRALRAGMIAASPSFPGRWY